MQYMPAAFFRGHGHQQLRIGADNGEGEDCDEDSM